MKFCVLVFFLFFSSAIFCQEIGSVEESGHFIKLHKFNDIFSFKYSDAESVNFKKEFSFTFTGKNDFYSILIDGFENNKSHQIILQTSNDTIVKLNYRKVKGELLLYVYQNNLNSKTTGRSTFFSKKQIVELFGIQQKV